MTNEEWINGKVEEKDINYTISGKNFLYKNEIKTLKKGVELLCKKLKPQSVLEFGFGMGWTATEFQKQGIQRHVILEPNKEIYQMALEWKNQYDDSDIEILNIFSWDFETNEQFNLVYDDIQTFTDNLNKEVGKHYTQMDKILPNGQWYAPMAYLTNNRVIDNGHKIVKKIENKYIVQGLIKYTKGRRNY